MTDLIVCLSQTDLIHLGAKFGPCMRRDKKIWKEIDKERALERDTSACCVRADGQNCYQSVSKDCVQVRYMCLN